MTADHDAAILLDTTSVIHIARDNQTGREITRCYGLLGRRAKTSHVIGYKGRSGRACHMVEMGI